MGTDEEPVEEEPAEDSSGGYAPPSSEPSWAKKLKKKMKALFCMQAQGQYKAHVTHKQSHQRDKKIMRIFGEHVSSGSEEIITPEAAWMAHQGYKWSDSDMEQEQQESDGEHDD